MLTFFLKQNVFPGPEGAAVNARLEGLLGKSWSGLTGKVRAGEQLLTRLPISVLRNGSIHDRVWHDASFMPLDRSLERAEQRAATHVLRDWVPTNAQIVAGALALTAGALSAEAGQALAGLAVMHAATSFHEFGVHRFMHPWKWLRRWIKEGPAPEASSIEKKVHESTFKDGPNSIADTISEHDVHHFWTYKNFTQMFSKWPKEAVDAQIDKRYSPEHAAKIKADKYASALTWPDIIKLSRTVLPQTALGTAACLALGVPWALVGVAAYFVAYPVATGLVHGHIIHTAAEERANGNFWQRNFGDNALIKWMARNHFMHHVSHEHSNFNVCFPGADIALGTYVKPNVLDLLRMDDEKVVYA